MAKTKSGGRTRQREGKGEGEVKKGREKGERSEKAEKSGERKIEKEGAWDCDLV